MHFEFGSYRLDPDRFELLRDGVAVDVEPQVFQVLLLLIRNRERMVSKDEIVEVVWHGRAISDASISSRISLARSVIGDDGDRQLSIRTVHGRGFRFVAAVTEASNGSQHHGLRNQAITEPAPTGESAIGAKPSIVVLPLQALGMPPEDANIADAISHDVIQALSRMRWLTVIARGSAFRFREPTPDITEISSALDVRYVLFGMVEMRGNELSATLELADERSGAIMWADRLTVAADAVHALRAEIVTHLVSALETYIPLNEAIAARLGASDRLDAWSSYHLGLHHMYRFTGADNARATALFEQAVRIDPGFARAHAGLSFTGFQDAFMRYVDTPTASALAARRHAEIGLELDPLDPFVNFTMGRSFWLTDDPGAAAVWLDRAIDLNPNYAQGFYARAFTAMLVGDQPNADAGVTAALRLSPFDPLLYGICGVRALALVQASRHDEAADWAERAATAPGAHFLIAMIALVANGLAGRGRRTAHWLSAIHERRPDASGRHFFAAFPISDPAARRLISLELTKHGL